MTAVFRAFAYATAAWLIVATAAARFIRPDRRLAEIEDDE